jgi:hypothetical protein
MDQAIFFTPTDQLADERGRRNAKQEIATMPYVMSSELGSAKRPNAVLSDLDVGGTRD